MAPAILRSQAIPPQTPAPPAPGTALIAGRVVEGDTDRPLTGTIVVLNGRGVPQQRVVVDPSGRFVFDRALPGPYAVTAVHPGYFAGVTGEFLPANPAHPFLLGAGQQLTDLRVPLWRGAVISGVVSGDRGQPLPGVEVQVLRRSLIGGAWRLAPAQTSTTDDRGRYRIGGLAPGSYAVVARPDRNPETALLLAMVAPNIEAGMDVMAAAMTTARQGPELDARVRNYPVTFWPDAASQSRATLIAVSSGHDRDRADFRLKSAPVVLVEGSVVDASGHLNGVGLRLAPADADPAAVAMDAATTATDAAGRFVFSGVVPGRYVVTLIEPPPGPPAPPPPPPGAGLTPLPADLALPARWANVAVVVGERGVAELTVPLHAAAVVSGRIEIADGGRNAATLAQVVLRLDSASLPAPANLPPPPQGPPMTVDGSDAARSFRQPPVVPGRYLLRVQAPPRWTVLSAVSHGVDALDAPLEVGEAGLGDLVVTIAERPFAGIDGMVVDETGQPRADVTVLLFPSDRRLWSDTSPLARRLKSARPVATGQFAIGGLPDGDYRIVAVAGDVPAEWQDAARLSALLDRAESIHLDQAGVHGLSLKVIK